MLPQSWKLACQQHHSIANYRAFHKDDVNSASEYDDIIFMIVSLQ